MLLLEPAGHGVAALKREKNVHTSDNTFIVRSVVYNVALLL